MVVGMLDQIEMETDMPSDPHLEGQTHILASQPAFSCWKFELALMEGPAFSFFMFPSGVWV